MRTFVVLSDDFCDAHGDWKTSFNFRMAVRRFLWNFPRLSKVANGRDAIKVFHWPKYLKFQVNSFELLVWVTRRQLNACLPKKTDTEARLQFLPCSYSERPHLLVSVLTVSFTVFAELFRSAKRNQRRSCPVCVRVTKSNGSFIENYFSFFAVFPLAVSGNWPG